MYFVSRNAWSSSCAILNTSMEDSFLHDAMDHENVKPGLNRGVFQ